MNVLGWEKLKTGDYLLDLPDLCSDEIELIKKTEELYREATREGKAEIPKLIQNAAKENGVYIDYQQENYLSEIAKMHILGYGFFDLLLQDGNIEEISVIGPKKPVFIFLKNEGWKSVNVCLQDERSINDMINRMAKNIGRHITLQNPRIDAMLKDGSRLHGSLPPISNGEITLRKFRKIPYSPLEISNVVPIDVLAFLSLLMQCDCSLLIAGNTASGKTTSMNALFSFVPRKERVLITEETPEISIPHEHQMRLVANKEMGINLKDLIYDTLRMRPDRIIVGEVRNKDEAEALFDVLMAGQARGSYATFHAQNVDEGISRLKSFGLNEEDIKMIDCLLVQRRMVEYNTKKRANVEIRKVVGIASLEQGKRMIYDGKMHIEGALIEKIANSFKSTTKEISNELEARKKMLLKSPKDFDGFFKFYQSKIFGD